MNLDNYKNIEQFVEDNIVEINEDSSSFQYKKLKDKVIEKYGPNCEPENTETEILLYLGQKLKNDLNDESKNIKDELLALEDRTITATKNKLYQYAVSHGYYYAHVQSCYEELLLKSVYEVYFENQEFRNSMFDRLLKYNDYLQKAHTDNQCKYIKNTLSKLLDKSLFLGLRNGFTRSIIDTNFGTKTADEGDCAQLLFVARAILAGFNCSNVDLRSSKYDAVIEYDGAILRVQVKGISSTSIYFKNRDRGGAGNDTSAMRNKGKYISSEDCDIYVAVDKQFGICYLIPAKRIDAWVSEESQ